jgi:hypothetical protein
LSPEAICLAQDHKFNIVLAVAYSAVTPAALITLPHFSSSDARKA